MARLACKEENVDWIFSLYNNYGDKDYIGEEISQQEHMLQAAQLAYKNNEEKEVILACLFHDIGHLLALERNLDDKNHEKYGAEELKKLGISEKIYTLVEKHVDAKKYLAYKDIKYLEKLSSASKKSLIEQGGIMTEKEALEFENNIYFKEAIKVRKYDDQAKEKNVKTESLDFFRNMI